MSGCFHESQVDISVDIVNVLHTGWCMEQDSDFAEVNEQSLCSGCF